MLALFASMVAPSLSLKIVSLYDTSISADAWNTRHEMARSAAVTTLRQEGYHVESVIEENISPSSVFDHYKQYTSEKADIIITTNAAHRDAFYSYINTTDGASQHFITSISLGAPSDKVFAVHSSLSSAMYLAGKTCGMMTKTNKIGFTLAMIGVRAGSAQVNAFALGARSVNPSVTIYMMQSMTFDNSSIVERRMAMELIDSYGVDCLMGGPSSPGAYEAAQLRNVSIIGLYQDFRYRYGENVLFSIMYNWTSLYLDGIRGYLNGTFPGRITKMGALGSTVVLSDFSTRVPTHVFQAIRQTYDRIVANTVCIFPWKALEAIFPASESSRTVTLLVEDSLNNTTPQQCLSSAQTSLISTFLITAQPALSLSGVPGGFIENPRNWTINETLVYVYPSADSAGSIILSVLASIGLLLCVALTVFVLRYRTLDLIRATSPEFMLVIIFGCVFMYASIFTYFGEPTVVSCHVRIWLFFLGYGVATAALLFKNFRIWRIFGNKSMTVFAITSKKLFLAGVLPALTVEVVLLLLWTIMDPYTVVADTSSPLLRNDQIQLHCASSHVWPMSIMLSYNALLLVVNIFISIVTRKIPYSIYREARQILFSSYNTALISIICLVTLMGAANSSLALEPIMLSITTIVISSGLLGFIFAERIILVWNDVTAFPSDNTTTTSGVTNHTTSNTTGSAGIPHTNNLSTRLQHMTAKSHQSSKSPTSTHSASSSHAAPHNHAAKYSTPSSTTLCSSSSSTASSTVSATTTEHTVSNTLPV